MRVVDEQGNGELRADLRTRRRWLLPAVGLVLVLVAAGVTALLLLGGDGGTASPPPLTQTQADDLAAVLSAAEPDVVTDALAAGLAVDFAAAPGPLLPDGARLTIDAASFRPGADGYGTVDARAGDAAYVVFLAREGDVWRVLGTAAR